MRLPDAYSTCRTRHGWTDWLDIAGLVRRVVDLPQESTLSPLLVGKLVGDQIACTLHAFLARGLSSAQWRQVVEEIDSAAELFEDAGWESDPVLYHNDPPALMRPKLRAAHSGGHDFQHLQFRSDYEPHAQEPGRDRWLSYKCNHNAHAWVMRHRGKPRPWMICIPGYGMGNPFFDLTAFHVRWLYERMGLNVLIPVLPFHGPRSLDWASGYGFLRGDCLDTVHAVAQAIWDLRRLISWVKASGAPQFGVYGISLGGYTSALAACFEPELGCVIAGIPATDLVALARHHTPSRMLRELDGHGLDWDKVARVMRVASPLALDPVVPHERRYVYAGIGDRFVPPNQVNWLLSHWDRPTTLWYEGSHITFMWEPAVKMFLRDTLRKTLCAPVVPVREQRDLSLRAA